MNKAHERAPKAARETPIPAGTHFDPEGIREGKPPPGVHLCLQAWDHVWRWWWVDPTGREVWCLEEPQGGDLSVSGICYWHGPNRT